MSLGFRVSPSRRCGVRPNAKDLVWYPIVPSIFLLQDPVDCALEQIYKSPLVGFSEESLKVAKEIETPVPDSFGRAPCTWADVDWGFVEPPD